MRGAGRCPPRPGQRAVEFQGGAFHQDDLDGGPGTRHAFQQLRHERGARAGEAAQGDDATGGPRCAAIRSSASDSWRSIVRVLGEDGTRVGERDRPLIPVEQRDTGRSFECGDVHADPGLRAMHYLGRRAETSRVDDAEEGDQSLETQICSQHAAWVHAPARVVGKSVVPCG